MSIEFHLLRAHAMAHVKDLFFDRANDAESMFTRERNAAVRIQRRWRGYRDRKYIFYLHTQATHIQRTYRAFRDRRRARLVKSRKQQLVTHQFYAAMATKIQKIIRGWLSRRLRANFYARRQYLRTLLDQGNAMEQEMHERFLRERAMREEEKAVREDQEFEKLTENLHHLLSTKAIPGVLSSRLGEAYAPSVYNIPLETHIKDQFVNRQRRLQQLREGIHQQSRRLSDSLRGDSDAAPIASTSSVRPGAVAYSSSPATAATATTTTKVPRDRVLPPIARTRSGTAVSPSWSEEEKQQQAQQQVPSYPYSYPHPPPQRSGSAGSSSATRHANVKASATVVVAAASPSPSSFAATGTASSTLRSPKTTLPPTAVPPSPIPAHTLPRHATTASHVNRIAANTTSTRSKREPQQQQPVESRI